MNNGSEAFLIASVIGAICIVCTVGSVKVGGFPKVSKPAVVKAHKLQDRIVPRLVILK